MSVVVAHEENSAVGRLALQEAAREAQRRRTSLAVINVAEGVDIDFVEAERVRLKDEIAEVLSHVDVQDVAWSSQVVTGEDIAEALLEASTEAGAEVLVVGARRRSRVGKLLMGSVSQTLILRADIPVLVVKAPD